MPKGVKIEDLRVGEGAKATGDSVVEVRYDLSLNRGDCIQAGFRYQFHLADRRRAIAGLRYGVEGMREGGKRRLRVSPHLAYGEAGLPERIPASAVLIFEVELLRVLPDDEAPAYWGPPTSDE